MERKEAIALVGRQVRIVNAWGNPTAFRVVLARYDTSRRSFTTRNLHTGIESPLSSEDLATGLARNTLILERR